MKKIKSVLAVLLTLALIASLASVGSALGLAEGTCGLDATWQLSFSGTLTVSGNGEVNTYGQDVNTDFKKYNSKIKSIVISSGISVIGANIFQGLNSLTTVRMGETVAKIDKCAFADCPILSNIKFPTGLVIIGANAFNNCTSLKSIVIPESVSRLRAAAFAGCTGLQTVEVQNKQCTFESSDIFPKNATIVGYKGSTAQTYAANNGLAFKVIDGTATDEPTTPTQPTTQPPTSATTDSGKCPLCGEAHKGFPGSLIGGIHSFIYWLLMLFGMKK